MMAGEPVRTNFTSLRLKRNCIAQQPASLQLPLPRTVSKVKLPIGLEAQGMRRNCSSLSFFARVDGVGTHGSVGWPFPLLFFLYFCWA